MKTARFTLLMVVMVFGGFAVPGSDVVRANQTPERKLAIYELEPKTGLSLADAERVSRLINLVPAEGRGLDSAGTALKGSAVFRDKSGKARLIFREDTGSVELLPELSEAREHAMPSQDAVRLAQQWLRQNGLWRLEDEQLRAGEVTILTRQEITPKGKAGEPLDAVRTVHLIRELDGLRVFGPTSGLTVDVGEKEVLGVFLSLRPLVKGRRIPTEVISQEEAREEFERRFSSEMHQWSRSNPEYRAQLASMDLVYYEQGLRFIQPVYRFMIHVTNSHGAVGDYIRLLPASRQPPELIPSRVRPAQAFPLSPKGSDLHKEAAGGPDPINYGMYVVRNDSTDWVDDAWEFHEGFDSGNFFGRFFFGVPPTQMTQYYWNYQWLWEAGGGQPDLSQYFVGEVNFAIIEGHGLPWWISTSGNCCDVIDLPKIAGYGGFNGKNGQTDYIVWKSCSVIPAPGDPYGTDYQSPATPFDVWWTIFQGLRGTYGFRTEMWIDDDISQGFAFNIGLGAANLASWFHATDNCKWDHSSSMEYGSAVLVSGHEGDRAYDSAALPRPGSLTIWWQHP